MNKSELINLILEDDELSMESDPREARKWLLDLLRNGHEAYKTRTKKELEDIARGREIINTEND